MKINRFINVYAVIIIMLVMTNQVQAQYSSVDSNVVQVSNEAIATPVNGLSIHAGHSGIIQSATRIKLKNGFHAQKGSNFRAFIAPVNSQNNLRVVNKPGESNDPVEDSQQDLFQLFPNPTSGIFHLTMLGNTFNEREIYLYDLLGNHVYDNLKTSESELDIDLTGYAKGIYLVKVVSEGKVSVSRVIFM